ncbi:MOSC and FAD-binding oxidoreductase domain-containing protein [Mycobacterium sp. CPCC 205372]|uniref:MOSC and FAD-binding oxidoreductase domain-containing protein n=1 Tax=Mycobacterium hippophais TaxID=3016340 RepID=A0ABT4PXE3_9MYCO|nr:MOSC and FAD-binding oxidoreductase domain-containing protein [Mycobacterium hippophais]MCZ8381221.1 MOSC and FAD-binding oxidoreductase domain-containing protein [Mycobacterium hippophais]
MATLMSVNVGLPRNVAWNDRTVYTGAWKHPVTGPRMVRRLNVDGDGQGDLGGHGGENRAVLVYQLDSYRHWAEEFGRDDLVPGMLGENLTVDGLPDDEVCIGDRFAIGDAVFEVTQPRVTCYRAGLRIGEPRMAALLVSHRRPGFYCRVITEGKVEAGQEIVKVGSAPEQVTVAEIDALLYLPGHPRDELHRALRIPALSPGWRTSLQSLAEKPGAAGNVGLTAAAGSPPPAWAGFRPLSVRAVHDESRLVRSITLADPDGAPLPEWLPGQAITLRLPTPQGPVIRNYSLSNRPGSGEYRISVKREPLGLASGHLHAHIAAGDLVDIAAPRGTFVLAEGDTPVILLSAGVGATPVLSMLHALADARSTRPVWWLHGARNGSEHPFARESRALLEQLPGSHSRVFFSSPASGDRAGVDYDVRGRLSSEAVGRLDLPNDADAYLCGPATFMAELGADLVARGLGSARVHTEIFGAAASLAPGIVAAAARRPHVPGGPPGPGPAVQFARSGISAPWGPPSTSLLEFAEACDVPTRWSCRTGVCHNCETPLLSGSVSYDPEPLEPPAEGNVLICCAQPAEPVVVDL